VRSRASKYLIGKRCRVAVNDHDFFEANITGSSRYTVQLFGDGETVAAMCDCPYIETFDGICKHIWAAILTADHSKFDPQHLAKRLILDGDDDFDRGYGAKPKIAPPKAEAIPEWKVRLQQWSTGAAPGSTGRLPANPDLRFAYIVPISMCQQHGKFVISRYQQKRKADGSWGSFIQYKPRAYQPKTFNDPIDRRIDALWRGATGGETYYAGYSRLPEQHYALDGDQLDLALPLFAESGRLHFRDTLNNVRPLAVDDGPPWQFRLEIETLKTQYNLAGELVRGDERMPVAAPYLIVNAAMIADGKLARIDHGGFESWLRGFRVDPKIVIPKANAGAFVEQLMAMSVLPPVELPDELKFAEVTATPRPRMIFFRRDVHDLQLAGRVEFDYEGTIIPQGTTTTRGLLLPDGKRYLLRDADAESRAIADLQTTRVKPSYYHAHSFEIAPKYLPDTVRDLTARGWHVEAEGKLFRRGLGLDLKIESGQDWFDLNVAVDFGDGPVAVPQLLAALRKGQTTVALDDGSVGMLPEEWLAKYGLLARLGETEGDGLRFGLRQIGMLDAILASRPEIAIDETFAKARNQLAKFKGIAAADPPKGFTGTLRDYQREGLGWLRFLRQFGFGGCLADDMGLGKTVQVLAHLATKRTKPTLIVVPKSLIFNWKNEAAKFAPKLKLLDHSGPERRKETAHFANYDVVLTTYGTLRMDAELFADFEFDTCILDESQAAKNAVTETAKAVRVVKSDYRLALSGTPIENHFGELETLFDFLNPGMLGHAVFSGAKSAALRNPDAETRQIVAKALRPFILRRTKDQVATDLPAKTEETVECELEPKQRKLYDDLRNHYRQSLLTKVATDGMAKSKMHVLEALLRLRQVACHPGLVDAKRSKEPSAKLDALLPQLHDIVESGRKALVFSQFTSFLSIVRNRLTAAKIPFAYLDGKTGNREELCRQFQTNDEIPVFLISLKAGGVGLNLTAADYVFLLDPWWNPAVEAQAIDRSHRIGQTKPVFAYRFIAKGTVEEKVLALQAAKRDLADAILGGDGRLLKDLKREDLEMLLS
jgi:superfamily II DNA or RNA helicase